MPTVENLVIKVKDESTYYATWNFTSGSGSSSGGSSSSSSGSSGVVRVGDLVSISSDAVYYNGTAMPDWVKSRQWYVIQVSGDRAVLGKDSSGSYNIQSAVNTKYLSGGSGSGSSTTTTPAAPSVSEDTVDHYEVKWYYQTGVTTADGKNPVWFAGSSSDETRCVSEYSIPDNATLIKINVTPVSKTYKDGDEEKSYWTGTVNSVYFSPKHGNTPAKPSAPTVTIDKYTLRAVLENIEDPYTEAVFFQVVNANDIRVASGQVNVLAQRAVFNCTVTPGDQYRVRCYAINLSASPNVKSEWSNFSGENSTVPEAVSSGSVKCYAVDKTSVKVTWTEAQLAKSYEVEYALKEAYFDSGSETRTLTVDGTFAIITSLESGHQWFFRVRAINDAGNSSWSSPVSTIIGTIPEAPTTWSLATTAIVGETLKLYWVHNCEDGSHQTKAQIKLIINGESDVIQINTPVSEEDEDEDEPIHSYSLSSSEYDEGAEILWSVRTKGIMDDYGDWSVQRTIHLYAPPTLVATTSITEDDTIDTLPIKIDAVAGPSTQNPVSYYVSIISNESYEGVNTVGEKTYVISGTTMYSKVFNTDEHDFTLNISAGDIILQNGQSYTLKIIVAMNSGLTAEFSESFTVSWVDQTYYPVASVNVDKSTLCAYVTPFCINPDNSLTADVTMSVYRRETNGTFTELMTGLQNSGVDTITDPHPSLDYARYRIVATNTKTGSVTYEDIPGQKVGEPSLVFQWDETWTDYAYINPDAPETDYWVGSMLRLPYNLDITENFDPDVSLVEYIGRSHPVSYYGTQKGETASWSTEIPKYDKETLFYLRKLAAWAGDVYVREPNGTGYWAKVNVNWSIKYLDVIIPVSFDITRVEGPSGTGTTY